MSLMLRMIGLRMVMVIVRPLAAVRFSVVRAFADLRLNRGMSDPMRFRQADLDLPDSFERLRITMEASMERRDILRAVKRPDMNVMHFADGRDMLHEIGGYAVAIE